MTKVVVKPSRIQGMGLLAAVGIREGERILVVDESRRVTECRPLPEGGEERHRDYVAEGAVVLLPAPERHRNHSCDPNAFDKYVNGVRYLVARRDIAAGEEITGDYSINGLGDHVWECNCGNARCRKLIHSDFFHLPQPLQLEYLPYLADWYKEQFRDQVAELEREAAALADCKAQA